MFLNVHVCQRGDVQVYILSDIYSISLLYRRNGGNYILSILKGERILVKRFFPQKLLLCVMYNLYEEDIWT